MNSSVARELFGKAGEIFHEVVNSLATILPGAKYHFMEVEEYQQLVRNSPAEGMRVYWTEMLCRAHWAATSNILRHKRWHDACLKLYLPVDFRGLPGRP